MPPDCVRDIRTVLAGAPGKVDTFRALAAGVPYERRGILFAEAFFVYACLADAVPPRIIESGRARGQSTLMLGRCFPGSRVVSIEYERDSKDAHFAEKRLAGLANVELMYGDARVLIPELLDHGDVVVIDGPKEHRALMLAYTVLATGRCPTVFLHDCYAGSPVRALIEASYPAAFFSDHPEFVRAYGCLDEQRRAGRSGTESDEWRPHWFLGGRQTSWGPTFACLPFLESFGYGTARVRVRFARMVRQLRRSAEKRVGRARAFGTAGGGHLP